MLGRLIQTAASYGRGNSTLESATEESHTRNLLYGHSQQVYSLATSPPTSPYGTPIFRPGSFDDRGGLELEEKDVRILIAQDAFGVEEKPTLLFDSRATSAPNSPPTSHVRHASMIGPRSPLPGEWKPQVRHSASIPSDNPFRSRSSSIATNIAPWSRTAKDAGTREEAFLECMFGLTNSTKAASTTKMHILPGKVKITSQSDSRRNTADMSEQQQQKRTPLNRSRTSNTVIKSPQKQHSSINLDTETQTHDSILITRLFSVALSETVAPTTRSLDTPASPTAEPVIEETVVSSSPGISSQSSKKPKLVERKVPAFAIGLIIDLPRHPDLHTTSGHPRPISRSAYNNALSSAASSYGSDMQNSWSFLNAIPESLGSPTLSTEESDRRIDSVVSNEDVILRAIALLEVESTKVIHHQLQKVLEHYVGPNLKTPKEKSMQRINQRIISITDASAISRAQSLQRAAKQAIRRVLYALRIPRVVTGMGFGTGHWTDEARTAYRTCGRKQQNFFLFTLLTAFLGHHTEWLERIAPEWYRRQYRVCNKQYREPHNLYQRTVIVSDQRAIARRLIFLLASFLPGTQGMDGLHKPGEDLPGPHLSMSSPTSQLVRGESLRRTANRRMREHRLHTSESDRVLSTSADSMDSVPDVERSRRFLDRKDSDVLSMKGPSLLSTSVSTDNRKSSNLTTSAMISHPATPVAVFSTQSGGTSDSYFPPFAEQPESVATVGLENILRRSSSSLGNSSNVSSRWGSLVSGLSEMWHTRQQNPGDSGSVTAYSSVAGSAERQSAESGSRRSKTNTLQDMVSQLDRSPSIAAKLPKSRVVHTGSLSPDELTSPARQIASAPRLRVDDQDGVVDVDLDLPGFARFDSEEVFKSPSKSMTRMAGAIGRDTAGSIRSLRSLPANSTIVHASPGTNVAGYLKRHHEDFCLHAVRPYPDLEDDVKRSMLSEPLTSALRNDVATRPEEIWIPVCSTIIADMRTFSVRRLTLRKKIDARQEPNNSNGPVMPVVVGTRQSTLSEADHTFLDEEVKDFDTVLADAIEKVLDLGDAIHGSVTTSPRIGHSRGASSGTIKSIPSSLPVLGASSYHSISREYARQDCRQVVLGALEEIVKDVCNDLGKLERGRDIRGGRRFSVPGIKEEMRQENILREGVKCWLLNLEQARVF